MPGLVRIERTHDLPDFRGRNKSRFRAWGKLRAEKSGTPEITSRGIAPAALYFVDNVPNPLTVNGKLRAVPEVDQAQREFAAFNLELVISKCNRKVFDWRVDGCLVPSEIESRAKLQSD